LRTRTGASALSDGLGNDLVVLGMRADPKPADAIFDLDAKCAMKQSDAN
jgi:hypothetical protein